MFKKSRAIKQPSELNDPFCLNFLANDARENIFS